MDSISYSTLEKQDTPTVWYGCYDGGWQGLITDQAFQHPAKFSRNLVNRIYAYALERGWLKIGDTVLDCFGGVGLGALDAGANGLNWVGVELERRFCDLGQGCDCTGISKADWVRFYGRWDKANYKDGRHWCPECLAEARKINPPAPQSFTLSLFDDEPAPSAAYVRNSGIIPETKPHHYTGNLELFKKYAKPGTFAVLLNGDSRNLRAVIGQGVTEGLLSSPPYADQEVPDWTGKELSGNKDYDRGRPSSARKYGTANGQLGAMPAGSLADSLLSSPSFAGNTGGRGEASRNGIDAALFDRHSGGMKKGTGDNPGNLDHLPMRGFSAALSSPPYINGHITSITTGRVGDNPESPWKQTGGDNYGSSSGQLGKMGAGSFDASLASPPFENQNACNDPKYQANRTTNGGPLYGDYGTTAGQLGTEQGGTFWEAAKMIVGEAYLALKDDSYQFWVVKAFIRDKKRVDFPGQWRQLCEACGFEFVESIYAMQISEAQYQQELNGDAKKIQKATKSFFRRTYEKKFPDNRIDWEEVLVMRKPGGRQ